MTPAQIEKLDKQLTKFLNYITDGMGRPERRRAMEAYLTGLLLDGERKTAVSMSKRLVEEDKDAEGMRQRLQQCVTISSWADDEVRRRLAMAFEKRIAPEAFVVDDTGFPKKGKHSVGVHRQYSGTLGRTDNCQVATSLHVAANETSGCIGMRLYLPEEWASDIPRRQKAGVPDDVVFKRKWQLAIDLLDDALGWGLPKRLVIADAGYGGSTDFRDALVARDCPYLVGISSHHKVWPPGSNPRLPKRQLKKMGRPQTRYRDGSRKIVSISSIGEEARYRKYTVPDGKGGMKSGYFAFERVHLAEGHTKGRPPSEELWLICEWRPDKRQHRYYVCNLPKSTAKKELARLVKLRWRVERDYQELKGEIGLDHFEGRTWRGFHHHATLCAVAHGFLAIQRRVFPPEALPMDSANGTATATASAHPANRHLSHVSSTN